MCNALEPIVKVDVPESHFLVQCPRAPYFRCNVPESRFSNNVSGPQIIKPHFQVDVPDSY